MFEILENKDEESLIRASAVCSIETIRGKYQENNVEKSIEEFLDTKKYERLVYELTLSFDYLDESDIRKVESFKREKSEEFTSTWVNNLIPVVKNRNATFFFYNYEETINNMKESCEKIILDKIE
ncbi:MAG: hypothetical protein AB1498_02085 [bacterium]